MICWRWGHQRNRHVRSIKFLDKIVCRQCDLESEAPFYETDPQYHPVEDNLTYIERLAKEKNLI
jgi:hypothetical protein